MWGRGKKEEEEKEKQEAVAQQQALDEAKGSMQQLTKQVGDLTAEVAKLKRELDEERKAKEALSKEVAEAKKDAAEAKKATAEAQKQVAEAQKQVAEAKKDAAEGAAKVAAQPAAKPTGMAIGAEVYVVNTGSDKLLRRDAPGLNSQILDHALEDGTKLTLLDGPISVDGHKWWYVRQDGNNAMAVVAGEWLSPDKP